jgi:hypothetical protein
VRLVPYILIVPMFEMALLPASIAPSNTETSALASPYKVI